MSAEMERSPSRRDVQAVPLKLPKKLIICCDGTWMDSDNKPGNPTNVTRIARSVADYDDDHHQQIVYYQAGVGTGLGLWNHLAGGGTGLGLAEHIREAYSFLVSNYSEPDDLVLRDSIFLLGFSRGAFTARSIGGLIGAVGLLKKKAMPFFHHIFQDWENAGKKHYNPQFFEAYFQDPEERALYQPSYELAHTPGAKNIDIYMEQYRSKLELLGLTQKVNIKAIGVWDTVGSLGIPVNPIFQKVLPILPSYFREYAWYDTRIGDHVENGFQALGLDERRAPYSPAVWEKPDDCKSNLKQVWFPGAHSNIGGSYDDTGMADITIAWMMDHLAGHDIQEGKKFAPVDWIKFDDGFIEQYHDERIKRYNERARTHKTVAPFRGWGLGMVYNSLTFPQSLAGKRVRTPGKYHYIHYQTGRADPNIPLLNTNEYIHASVRARVDLGGFAPEPDWDQAFPHGFNILPWRQWLWYHLTQSLGGKLWPPYRPSAKGQPLHQWELHDGHAEHKQVHLDSEIVSAHPGDVKWKFVGGRNANGTVMQEDRLGPYERLLLEKDHNWERIEVDNQGWVRRIVTRAFSEMNRSKTV